MRRSRRDVVAVAAVSAGLILAAIGMPARADTDPPATRSPATETPNTDTPDTDPPGTGAPPTDSPDTETPGGDEDGGNGGNDEPTDPPGTQSPPDSTDEPSDPPPTNEEPDDEPTDGSTDSPQDDSGGDSNDDGDGGDGDGGDGEQTDEAPDAPSSPPAEETNEDPGDAPRRDPDEVYQEALKDAHTVAVAEAQRNLHKALGAIDAATAKLNQARDAAETARSAEEEALRQLKIATQKVDRTQREIGAVRDSTEGAREALGTVAREAYQNSGFTTLGVLLGAETPDELSDRYLGMRTLLRVGDTALGRLATDEANLRNAAAKLEGQRKEKERLAQQAAQKREDKEAAEQAAADAQEEVVDEEEKYRHAKALADEARLEDYERYMALINESTAIAEYLEGLSEQDQGPGRGTGSFVRPATGSFTSEYGQRRHPILGYVKMHTGLDFGFGDGNIYAADSGTVIEATFNTAYGNMVIIDHGVVDGSRITTLYAHQAGLSVSAGQRVEKGQVIGQIGSTGYSTGPHLHFEVRRDGAHTDPRPWVEAASMP